MTAAAARSDPRKLAAATFKCLHCRSFLRLRGQHAQALAESGRCPICNWLGAVTMPSFKVAV